MFKSVYENQDNILKAIQALHCPIFDCDITYGNGVFYKNIEKPKFCFDIDPLFDFVEQANCINLPLNDNQLNSVVCDLPFLTYIKNNRIGNGNMIMAKRFAGYWRYEELAEHYQKTLKECFRILNKNGKLIFKCQDIVHNHKFVPTHVNCINWAKEIGFNLLDLFILVAKHRLPSPNKKGKQKHARIFSSYFLVFEKIIHPYQ